jgi:hypothetical protein
MRTDSAVFSAAEALIGAARRDALSSSRLEM